MIQNKKLLQLVISAVMALLFVNFYLKSKEQTIETSFGMVSVLSAARDIPPQSAITADDIAVKQVPLKFLEPGAIMVKYPGAGLDRVLGKVTLAPIPAGGQITQSNLNNPSPDKSGAAPLLPPGKRGYTLRLGNLDVADIILPGDHIDILATFTVRQKDAQSKATYTILQNILVIGVGKDLKPRNLDIGVKKESTEGLILTLAVDPTEAERLSLAVAESQGEITVTVRAHGDDNIHPVPGVTPSNLLG